MSLEVEKLAIQNQVDHLSFAIEGGITKACQGVCLPDYSHTWPGSVTWLFEIVQCSLLVLNLRSVLRMQRLLRAMVTFKSFIRRLPYTLNACRFSFFKPHSHTMALMSSRYIAITLSKKRACNPPDTLSNFTMSHPFDTDSCSFICFPSTLALRY